MANVITCLDLGLRSISSEIKQLGHTIVDFDFHGGIPDFIRACREEQIDLAFIDLGPPIRDQFRVLDRLVEELPDLPIVFINAMPNEWQAHCEEAGHTTVTVIPIDYKRCGPAVTEALAA